MSLEQQPSTPKQPMLETFYAQVINDFEQPQAVLDACKAHETLLSRLHVGTNEFLALGHTMHAVELSRYQIHLHEMSESEEWSSHASKPTFLSEYDAVVKSQRDLSEKMAENELLLPGYARAHRETSDLGDDIISALMRGEFHTTTHEELEQELEEEEERLQNPLYTPDPDLMDEEEARGHSLRLLFSFVEAVKLEN